MQTVSSLRGLLGPLSCNRWAEVVNLERAVEKFFRLLFASAERDGATQIMLDVPIGTEPPTIRLNVAGVWNDLRPPPRELVSHFFDNVIQVCTLDLGAEAEFRPSAESPAWAVRRSAHSQLVFRRTDSCSGPE